MHIPPTHDYVATCPACGKPTAYIYDQANRETAQAVATYLRQGMTITRVALADLSLNALLHGCACADPRTPPRFRSYAAYAPCGHMVAVCSADSPERAASVADWITGGLRVEQVEDDIVRTSFGCNCPKPVQMELF